MGISWVAPSPSPSTISWKTQKSLWLSELSRRHAPFFTDLSHFLLSSIYSPLWEAETLDRSRNLPAVMLSPLACSFRGARGWCVWHHQQRNIQVGSLSIWSRPHPPQCTCLSVSSTPVVPSKWEMLWKGALVHLYNVHLHKPGASSMATSLPMGEASHAAGNTAHPCNALVYPREFTIPVMMSHPFIF